MIRPGGAAGTGRHAPILKLGLTLQELGKLEQVASGRATCDQFVEQIRWQQDLEPDTGADLG